MERRASLANGTLLFPWIASLPLPVVTVQYAGMSRVVSGFGMLASGWMGPLVFQFAWYANLLLPAALYIDGRDEGEGRASFLAIGGCLLALACEAWLWRRWYMDEGGGHATMTYHAGYYCWIVAVAGTGGLLFWHGWRNRRTPRDLM